MRHLPAQRSRCARRAAITSDWDGSQCTPRGDAPAKLAIGTAALAELKVDDAKAALDQVEKAGPLDHATNVTLWEQRGIAAAYVDDEASATSAFDMLLALDPSHFLSYELSPKATLVFEKTLKTTKARGAPAVDVSWPRGGKVGDPVPIEVDVLADPKKFLARATLFVRTRGESSWRAADLSLAGARERRVVLPAVHADKPVSLEVYLLAYDAGRQRGPDLGGSNAASRDRAALRATDAVVPDVVGHLDDRCRWCGDRGRHRLRGRDRAARQDRRRERRPLISGRRPRSRRPASCRPRRCASASRAARSARCTR